MSDLFNLRRDFTSTDFNESDLVPNPMELFELWFNEVKNSRTLEPNAMCLSTVDKNGRPSSRIVLLKQIREDSFVFFTNYLSKKGLDIERNPYCALNFAWYEKERQVRIEGIVERILPEESDSYFASRPALSQISAVVSPQSEVIENKKLLELQADELSKVSEKEIYRPDYWGGYQVKPYAIEFWQGRPNRLHDRFRYLLKNGSWKIDRLAP